MVRLPKPKEIERREVKNTKQKRERLRCLIREQEGKCYLCGDPMLFAVLEHVTPGKMGGCKDDSDDNLKAACWKCNFKKGSKRI
jgi:5-methylcytosine-specific restriction endonuclease McrA